MQNYLGFRTGHSMSDLERIVAEYEDNLVSYYVGREYFLDRALSRDDLKSIFYGPKGVGKSAILQMVKLEERSRGNEQRVISITPDDLAFNALSNLETTSPLLSDVKKRDFVFKSLWNYVLCTEILSREFQGYNAVEGLFTKILGSKNKAEQKKLIDITLGDDGTPASLTAKMLSLVEAVQISGGTPDGSSITGRLEVGESNVEQNMELLQLINQVTKKLSDNLTHEYYVLIDDLDLDWDGSLLQSEFIGAMFHSIRKLSKDTRSVKFVVSLRKEIYREIDLSHRDKFRDFVEEVRWSKQLIMAIIEERVAFVLSCSPEQVWGKLFPDGAFEFLYDLTGGMPREMIRVSVSCIKAALGDIGRTSVQASDINEGVKAFSEQRLDDLGSDFRFQYPRLSLVCKLFRGMKKEFDSEAIETVSYKLIEKLGDDPAELEWATSGVESPLLLARTLLRTGFLLFKAGRSDYARIPEEDDITLLERSNWFAIHPMYQAGLGLDGYNRFS